VGNSNFETGKLGEHICATKLMKMGETCEIVNLDCVDIIVNRGEQGLVRLQVKSSHYKRKDNQQLTKGYQFFTAYGLHKRPLTIEQCDAIGFVALDIERVIFAPVSIVGTKKTKRFARAKFNQENIELNTWATTLEGIYQ
tara:strand:+ start:148 stop:567 length:420 start_codon:yes stop_codon:yes gene_type:complete